MKFSSSLLIYWIILCLPLMNCGGNFLDRRDSNNIDADDFYQDEADAIASVNAAYAQLQSLYLWARGVHFLLDFTSGEIGQTPNTQGPSLELLSYTFGSHGNDLIEGPWTGFYQTIAKTNITLDAVPNIDMDGPLQRQVLAEARFLRALSYFYLNVLWNGGPLRTEENLEQLHLDRASSPDIWSFIEADLTTAIPDLPWEYDVANVGRATKGAALSLLGKAHLYQEAWADAEQNFSRVIQEGPYQLMGEGAATVKEAIAAMRSNHDFGVKNNAEAVFEVQFKGKAGGLYWQTDGRSQRESTIRPHEYGVNGKSFFNAKPSENLLSAFEGYDPTGGNTGIGERDPRFEAFFFTEHDTLDVGPYADILANSGYAWKK
ncbi:MAG: RagB/SusD family nutrient uptake outer membrane protein [Bacteroidota bacterium]